MAVAAWRETRVDDSIAMRVDNATCGLARLSAHGETARARGQFCLVTLLVANRDTVVRYLLDAHQLAYDAQGVEYGVDLHAAAAANGGREVWADPLQPGGELESRVLVYDLPDGEEITVVVLHAHPVSAGIRVDL